MRYTKYYYQDYLLRDDIPNELNNSCEDRAINKLGALENIEEDLGIDLVKLANIKSVIYIRNALGEIREIDTKDYGLNINLLNKAIILDRNYYFKDYGKTWFYTKEELKNGKKNR